jgi:hypothetical protein
MSVMCVMGDGVTAATSVLLAAFPAARRPPAAAHPHVSQLATDHLELTPPSQCPDTTGATGAPAHPRRSAVTNKGAAVAPRVAATLGVTRKRAKALRQSSGSFRSNHSSPIKPISEAPRGPLHARIRPARQAHSRDFGVTHAMGHHNPGFIRASLSPTEPAIRTDAPVLRNARRRQTATFAPATGRCPDSCVRCVMSVMDQ